MEREIRLLSIVTRMNVGGPAVQISTLMRSFYGSRVYQVLLTGNVGPGEEDYLALQGADLRYQKIKGLQREVSPRKDAEALARIAHFIRGYDPDIIHTHTAKAGSLGRAAALLVRSRAKRIHTFHGHLLHGYFTASGTKRVIQIERRLAKHSDRLIAVGQTVKEDLLAEGIGSEDKFRIVAPGIELGSVPSSLDARVELGLPPQALTVSFIGRLTPIKRIDRLVETLRIVHQSHPDVRFIVAGDGSEMHRIIAAQQEEGLPIHALGWRTDVERILAASDLTILTSDNEGTPVSLIQAGLIGVPAVAANVGSVSDVVVDGQSGYLTRPHPQHLAAALIRLVRDQAERESMSRFSTLDYRLRFGAEMLVNGHLAIYDEVLAEG